MDSFSEPYTRQGDDISLDQVRDGIRELETQHRNLGIPLSGRVLHVCHYLPVFATLNSRPAVPSPPLTPPIHPLNPDAPTGLSPSPTWSLSPRYGHAAMISGIQSLSATHEQLIIGWTGDIQSPIPNDRVPSDAISSSDRAALDDALRTYQPKESDPDDDKKMAYVPVWLDETVAHGHYDGYCKQSAPESSSYLHAFLTACSPLAAVPLPALAGRRNRIRFCRCPLPPLRVR